MKQRNLNGYFFKLRGFYFLFIPVKVPYKKIYAAAEASGLKQKEAFGPILEKGSLFGFGWIGIEVEKPPGPRPEVIHVQGDFQVAEHRGPYRELGKACQKIRKEAPQAKDYLFLYLDDPEKVEPQDLRTQILFR